MLNGVTASGGVYVMTKLLSIAIPTYNRPEFLEAQLNWLSIAIRGFEEDCEIIISDDGSTDNTSEVIKKWQVFFREMTFRLNVNEQNGGPVKNIAKCINLAQGQYVWVVGDDDNIDNTAIAYIFNSIQANPNLTALILNYSVYFAPAQKMTCDRYFDIQEEGIGSPGKMLLEPIFIDKKAANGIGFVTSLIYRTEVAQQSIQDWQPSLNNFEAPGYWTGFCGIRGDIKISKNVLVQYNCGMNSQPNDKQWFEHHYSDLPELYVKLAEIGYDAPLLRRLTLEHFKQSNLRVIFGSLRRWPQMTLRVMIPYLGLILMTLLKISRRTPPSAMLFSHRP
jgi:abequosyltransferase